MFFNLVVCELENLHAVGEGRLGRLGFGKVVADPLVGVSLLDVVVVEVHDCVAVGEHLPLYPVIEDDFLFTVFINSLDFSIVSNYLLDDL